jgi:hypothetical protein
MADSDSKLHTNDNGAAASPSAGGAPLTAASVVIATSAPASVPVTATGAVDISAILRKSALRALDGGVAGATAMAIQVTSLMWLHTVMNYQYRNGTRPLETVRLLYQTGGIRRFYRGYGFALMQGPLARFGDTAANTGVLAAMNAMGEPVRSLPIGLKTICGSLTAACWRVMLMPIDCTKVRCDPPRLCPSPSFLLLVC